MRRRFAAAAVRSRTARRVLLHADFYEDHLIVARRRGRRVAVGMIDFGDALAGDPLYEWMPVWWALVRRDPAYFRAFGRAFRPSLPVTRGWRDRVLPYLLAHEFAPAGVASETAVTRPA